MRFKVLIAVGIAAALAALIGASRFRAFVGEDPAFCAQCHRTSPEFALWNTGEHRGIACQKCHHASTSEGLTVLRAFLLAQPMPGAGAHAEVQVGACAACHLSHDPEWEQVGESRGHRVHAVEKKIACVRCHGAGVHRFEPAAASCRDCHGDHAVLAPGMQKLHCFACHDFLSVERELRPTRRDCLRCHSREGVLPARFPEDGPHDFACAGCHKPHAKPESELVACEACHADLTKAGLHADAGHRRCADCHRAHRWKSEREDCYACHRGAGSHFVDRACGECHAWSTATPPPRPPRGN